MYRQLLFFLQAVEYSKKKPLLNFQSNESIQFDVNFFDRKFGFDFHELAEEFARSLEFFDEFEIFLANEWFRFWVVGFFSKL